MDWLPNVQKIDMSGSRGNGRFGTFLGVILHVNVSGKGNLGTSIDYFKNNPGQVCPTFQVYKDGSIVQFLPLNWQPWCQIDGNFNYGAIETGGDPDEPLTTAQLASCARIVKAFHDELGMSYDIADAPGQRGIGTHQMGGAAWGGHACPGTIRAAQRKDILALAKSGTIEEVDPLAGYTLEQIAEAMWSHVVADANGKKQQAQTRLIQTQREVAENGAALTSVTQIVADLDKRVPLIQAAQTALAKAIAGLEPGQVEKLDVAQITAAVTAAVHAQLAAITFGVKS